MIMATNSTSSIIDGGAGGSENDSSTAPATLEISAEQEFCLYELETTDSTSVGLVLSAIYDNGDVHKFVRALERRIAFYDKNILKVCTYHYQGFLDSIKQLVHLNDKCKEIKKIAEETNEFIQADSVELMKKGAEIVRYRRLQRNANLAIDQILMCLPVLDSYMHLQKLMEENKYLQALKVLEDLEHNHFAGLQKYRFAQRLVDSVGPMRKEISNQLYTELTNFLELLHSKSHRVGAETMSHTANKSKAMSRANTVDAAAAIKRDAGAAARANAPPQLTDDGRLVKTAVGVGAPASASVKPNGKPFKASSSPGGGEATKSEQDSIDYGPVYRCCQIFSVLRDRESFEVYYRKQRRAQASVLIDAPLKSEAVGGYVRYLEEVMGFFVIEDRMMQIQPTLVSVAHRDQLWEMALGELVNKMSAHFDSFRDVEMMLNMKEAILLFTLTVKNYGYNTGPLYTLLQNFRDRYNEMLMSEYSANFENALNADNYTPITVTNESAYRAIVDEFPMFKRTVDREEYPRKFPFSQFVPSVLVQAKGYLVSCLRFMENLQLTQSEINDTIRRYANMLLARWSGSLKEYVSNRSCSLIQLVQITINMGYLERSRGHLDQFILRLVSAGEGGIIESGHVVALDTSMFRDTRSEVEQLINNALEEKVSAFLEIANYDWELTKVSGIASEYVIDLVNFLRTTFTSFTNLPSTLARNAFIQTCKHLAESLHHILVRPEVKVMSPAALEQFSLDMIQCELFADQRPVADIDNDTVQLIFAPIRQLLDLFLNDDWTTFFAERGKPNSRYSHVRASSAAALLDRQIEFEKKSSGFFGITRGDRKRLQDTVLRKLRALND